MSSDQRGILVDDDPIPIPSGKSEETPLLTQDDGFIGNPADVNEELFTLYTETSSPESIMTGVGAPVMANDTRDMSPVIMEEVATELISELESSLPVGDVDAEKENATEQSIMLEENLEAVLLASESAMFLAEATLPAEVKEELGSFGANSTSFAPALSTPVDEPVEIVPAKEVVGEPATKSIVAPSVMKILKFAIPAVGVWLCAPLLSLIDTSAVGKLSGIIGRVQRCCNMADRID